VARSVLIVDDSITAMQLLKQILEESGEFTVVGHARSMEDAVRAYATLRPDLVTMDIVMPEGDGLETTRRILATDPNAKIVVVSSLGEVKDKVVGALGAGAKSVIPKPFEKDAVLKALRALK
jgi:two-component system, chemotaxis family, chemotaxis protein CheY